MQNGIDRIVETYDRVAEDYAAKFLNELVAKPLDCLLLQDFAVKHGRKGKLLDLGCGPGQTTRFLFSNGCIDVIGSDISPKMISKAAIVHADIISSAMTESPPRRLCFEVADMLQLKYSDNSFVGAIAFYSIVNFDYDQVAQALREVGRVLQSDSHFLFSFHVGDQIVHLSEFLHNEVDIRVFFLDPERIINILQECGFVVLQTVIRFPYEGLEHPSKRAKKV